MKIEKQNSTQEESVTWVLPLDDPITDHGTAPDKIPFGSYSAIVGFDGRSEGELRRSLGFTTWMDVATEPTAATAVWENAGVPSDAYNVFHDMQPFAIRRRDSDQFVYGVVLFRAPYGAEDANPTAWIYWKDATSHDLADTRKTGGGTGWDGFNVQQLYISAASDDSTFIRHYVQKPPIIISGGAVAYLHQPLIRTNVVNAGGSGVLWVDSVATPNQQGWRFDYLGTPSRTTVTTDSGLVTTNGKTLIGRYRLFTRLADSFRRRVSQAGWAPAGGTFDQLTPATATEESFVADNGYITVTLNATTFVASGPTTGLGFPRLDWDRWQVFSTLSNGDDTQAGGGQFYFVDEMPTSDAFRNSSAATATMTARVFSDNARDEDLATYTGDATARQSMAGTDRSIAQQARYDFELDEWFDSGEISEVYAGALFKGLHVLLAAVRTRSADNTLSEREASGFLDLVWSDVRSYLPENFSIVNRSRTTFTRDITLDPDVTPIPDASAAPAFAMSEASNSLYVFGSGEVYRIRRGENLAVDVDSIAKNIKIVSRNAVASYGQGIVLASESGFFMLDGASGSMTPIRGLTRLLRDRWAHADVRRTIQLAYDEEMDAVYVLCAARAEIAILWVSTNRITFESGANFAFLREARLPDIGSSGQVKRALFMSHFGKIVYPTFLGDPYIAGHYTMHGTGLTVGTPPSKPVLLVTSVTASSVPLGTVWTMSLSTTLTGTPVPMSASPWLLAGATMRFLTGPLAGQTVSLYTYSSFADNVSNVRFVSASGENLSGVVGSLVEISPIESTLVGGPLAGTSAVEFLQRRHAHAVCPVAVKLEGPVDDIEPTLPLFRGGVLLSTAIYDSEIQDEDRFGPTPLYERALRVMRPFVDLTHADVAVVGTPPTGSFDTLNFDRNYGYLTADARVPSTGFAGAKLLPVLDLRGHSVGARLLEWYVDGSIAPSTKAR